MSTTKLGLSAIALVIAATHHASADPDFCKTPGVAKVNLAGGVDAALGGDASALANLVAASCGKGGAETTRRAGDIAAARAKWSKRLDMTEADWADVALWATYGQAQRNSPSLKYDPKQAWSAYDAIDQYANLSKAPIDAHYLADALGSKLTETGRLGYLIRCLESRKVGERAICGPDLAAFDPKKISGELRAATRHDGYERTVIRLAADGATTRFAEHAAAMKQLAAKDPGYRKLFDLAADAHGKWTASSQLLDVTLAMDDARVTSSNKALDRCEATTWAAFETAVGAIPAKKFADLKDDRDTPFIAGAVGVLINDPAAYLASVALVTCKSGGKRDALERFLGGALQRWPGFRGPRSASYTAMLTAGIKLDDRDARIEFPEVRRVWFSGGESMSGGGRGAVAAVKLGGATAVVEFVKKMRTEQVCVDWKDTNRISMISSSGTVYYEYNCIKYGTSTYNEAPAPKTVNARYAKGINPGVIASVVEDVVTGVWPKAGGAPTAVFGVAVN